jgi:hypothetical protein
MYVRQNNAWPEGKSALDETSVKPSAPTLQHDQQSTNELKTKPHNGAERKESQGGH